MALYEHSDVLQDVCRANGIARDNSDLFVVIARSADAAAECTLGAITAAMMAPRMG